jgi:hypothetical protein
MIVCRVPRLRVRVQLCPLFTDKHTHTHTHRHTTIQDWTVVSEIPNCHQKDIPPRFSKLNPLSHSFSPTFAVTTPYIPSLSLPILHLSNVIFAVRDKDANSILLYANFSRSIFCSQLQYILVQEAIAVNSIVYLIIRIDRFELSLRRLCERWHHVVL